MNQKNEIKKLTVVISHSCVQINCMEWQGKFKERAYPQRTFKNYSSNDKYADKISFFSHFFHLFFLLFFLYVYLIFFWLATICIRRTILNSIEHTSMSYCHCHVDVCSMYRSSLCARLFFSSEIIKKWMNFFRLTTNNSFFCFFIHN